MSLESYLKIDHRVNVLLSVEIFNNISKLQSNITTKWPAGSYNINVSQKKGDTRDTRSLCICYLKVIEGQISLSTLFATMRVSINSSFFGYFDSLSLKDLRFKSCERIYTTDFSLFQKIKSIDVFVKVYQTVGYVSVNSKPDHPPLFRAIPRDSHVVIAWGSGFRPTFFVWGSRFLNWRNFLQF